MIDSIIDLVKHYPVITGFIFVVIVGLVKLIIDYRSIKSKEKHIIDFYNLCQDIRVKFFKHEDYVNDYQKFLEQIPIAEEILNYDLGFRNSIKELKKGFIFKALGFDQRRIEIEVGLSSMHEIIISWRNSTLKKERTKVKKNFWYLFNWFYIGIFAIIDYVFGYLINDIKININDSVEKILKFLTGIAGIIGAVFEIYTNYNKF